MRYTKMHGAGNEFIILENMRGEFNGQDSSTLAQFLCSKNTGPGADGLIIVMPPENPEEDIRMLFYNADGTLGEMCGNGARCIARYSADNGFAQDNENIRITATAGMVFGRKICENRYEVRLNDPTFIDLHRVATVDGKEYECAYVELGNPCIPHAVLFAEPERELGRKLRSSDAFPKGANISFVKLTGDNTAEAVTFERGVEDFTKACGTGCGSIASALTLMNIFHEGNINIRMPGGELTVRLTRNGNIISDIYLTGGAEYVSEGEF